MFSNVAGVSFFRAWKRNNVMICLPHSRRKGVVTMHLIKDENGNLIQHGHEHTHQHTHADGVSHTHAHTHDGTEGHDHTHMRYRTAVQTAAAAREGTAGMRQ